MNTINITLNGVNLSGTSEDILAFAKLANIDLEKDGQYYLSSTNGLIKISEMETSHLKNALLKRWIGYINSLRTYSNSELIERLSSLPKDRVITNMLYTLSTRS